MPELTTAALEEIITRIFRDQTNPGVVANAYTVDELIHGFENLRRTMKRTINNLDEQQIVFSPDANTYSLSEVVTHLVAAQGMTYNAFLDSVSSSLPHIDPVPRNPGGGAEKGVNGTILQQRLQKATDELTGILRKVYDPATEKEVQHFLFGPLSFKGWMLFQLAHDLDHLRQAQAVRRAPGFPAKLKAQ
jgi:hypothetical protein